jgi:hypothetical protein
MAILIPVSFDFIVDSIELGSLESTLIWSGINLAILIISLKGLFIGTKPSPIPEVDA